MMVRLFTFCSVLGLLFSLPSLTLGDEKQPSLADRAVIAKYRVARLLRDASNAKGTIKQAERTIKSAPPRIKTEQAAYDKAKAAGNENELKRVASRLKREKDRFEKAKADKAAAEKAIRENGPLAKEATKAYEQLRKQAIAAELKRAAGQQPLTISKKVDALIDRRLAEAKIMASARTADGKFLRRVTLDIAGRIPTYEEVVAFLDDKSPDKRARAVNRLLASEDYGRTFGTIFADLTTHRPTTTANRTKDHFREWLIESYNLNRRWDDIVTDMIAGTGDSGAHPGNIFLVAYRFNNQPNPPDIIAAAGEMFMGLQIKCAQCHNHPFVDKWSQDDFWSMAALFSRVRLKGNNVFRSLEFELTDEDVAEKELFRVGGGVKYPPALLGGKIPIPDPTDETKTLRTVSAKFLDGRIPKLPPKGFYRRDFAEWLTSTDNPYFARAAVNRTWGHFFARGLVHPIANMNPDNKPTHPEALAILEEEFKRSGYDLKHLIRCIVGTEAYQRSSKPLDGNANDKTLYSHMAVKTLEADALFDSLTVAIGRPIMTNNRRETYKNLFDTRLPTVDPGKFTHSIPQILRIMNAREYNEAGTIVSKVTNGKPPAEAIEGLFLAALSRRPSADEKQRMQNYVDEAEDKRQAYADVYWVLINSAEFLVNH